MVEIDEHCDFFLDFHSFGLNLVELDGSLLVNSIRVGHKVWVIFFEVEAKEG